jgi:hypothetical protein
VSPEVSESLKPRQFGMADPVIVLGCDIGASGKDQTLIWSDDKIKSLWSSLLNLEFVSKCHEDLEVQGILLLLETIFGVFTGK